MARAFWPKEDPVGRAIRLGGSDGPRLMVVGVVRDVHYLGLDAPVQRQFFRPYHASRLAGDERRRAHDPRARHVRHGR